MHLKPVELEHTYAAPPERLWSALTNPDEMRLWYFDIHGFRAEEVHHFHFDAGPAPDRSYRHLCQVVEARPPHRLAYIWRYEGFPGDTLVAFDLEPDGTGTRLRLTHSGIENIAQHHADFAQENFIDGWTHFLKKALPEYLGKKE